MAGCTPTPRLLSLWAVHVLALCSAVGGGQALQPQTPSADPWHCLAAGQWCGPSQIKLGEGLTQPACEAACANTSYCRAVTFYPNQCGTGCMHGGCCFAASACVVQKSSCPHAVVCENPTPPPPSPATFDLRPYESSVFAPWVAQFDLGGLAAGNYSFVPTACGGSPGSRPECTTPTLYGSQDVSAVFFILGHLDGLTAAQRNAWADHIQTFQLPNGSFSLRPWERAGFQPWHGDTTGVVGMRRVLPDSSTRAPKYPLLWASSVLNGTGDAASVAKWTRFFNPLLNSSLTIWSASHCIAGVPLSGTLFNTTAAYEPFLRWYWEWLDATQDPATGYWVENPAWRPPHVDGLGGAFHMLDIHLHLGRPWKHPEAVLNTSLALQHTTTGLWGASRYAGFIDMDGVWTAIRSSEQLGRLRWDEVRVMCTRFMASQTPLLTTPAAVLGTHSPWSVNTHSMMAPLAAAAECQRAFPDLVRTAVPWRDTFASRAPW